MKNLHFTTVLGVRRARSDERVASASSRICISPQFWASDEHEVTRGLSPAATYQTYPAEKKRRKKFYRGAAFSKSSGLSSFSQQLFSAAFLSSSSQQLFSAAFLSSPSQQLFSAAFLSSSSQQPFSAALLSSSSQLSSCCGQGLVVS